MPDWIRRIHDKPRCDRSGSERYFLQRWLATPVWANLKLISKVYEDSRTLRKTGKDVVVDHIIPLNCEYVCGLHVHNNLCIISRRENYNKTNKQWPDSWSDNLELRMISTPKQERLV